MFGTQLPLPHRSEFPHSSSIPGSCQVTRRVYVFVSGAEKLLWTSLVWIVICDRQQYTTDCFSEPFRFCPWSE